MTPTVLYRRANFATRLPASHLYTPSHCWLARAGGEEATAARWRVGYTKFALRMLGELVDVQFTCAPETAVQTGDMIGTIEGFKAISDIYAAGRGRFVSGNPALGGDLECLTQEPYTGWLYEFEGAPDTRCLDVNAYQDLLSATIDRIMSRQKTGESET